MDLDVQTIFRGLSPYSVAQDAGLEIRPAAPDELGCILRHSVSGEDIVISDSGFIALDPNSAFIAGDVFDLLATVLGGYRAAVEHVLARYSQLASNPFGFNLPAYAEFFAKTLEIRRQGFMGVLALRDNLVETPHRYSDVVMWLQSRQIEPEAAFAMAYAATGRELNAAFANPMFADTPVSFQDHDQYVVLPFFRDYHEFGTIQIQNAVREEDQLLLYPNGGHGFFGLQACTPTRGHVQVYRNVSACLEARGQLFRRGMAADTVSIPYGFIKNPRPKRPCGIFVMDEQQVDLGRMVFCRQVFDRFDVSMSGVMGFNVDQIPAISWHDYLRHYFAEGLRLEPNCGPRLLSAVDAMKSDPAACDHIVAWLEDRKYGGVLAKVKARIGSHRKYNFERVEVTENACGYAARKRNSNVETPFTNFTIRIDRNVYFLETDEMFHQGRVTISGRDFPICLSKVATEKANLIEDIATASVLRNGGADCGIPRIIDPGMKKALIQVIKHQAGPISPVFGIKRVGWDVKQKTFLSPCWQATALGVKETSQAPYPGSELLAHYSFHQFSLATTTDKVSNQTKSFIAILAAMVVRILAGKTVPAVPVRRSPGSWALLHALFYSFSQTKPIPVSLSDSRLPTHYFERELSGYPAFGASKEEVPFSTIHLPMFILSESGMPYTENLLDDVFFQVYTLTHQIITQLVVGFLRSKTTPAFASQPTPAVLVYEGRRAIEEHCGLASFTTFDEGLSNVWGLLASIPATEVCNHFHRDPSTDMIFMDFHKLAGHDRKAIHTELQAFMPEALLYREHQLAVPAELTLQLMTQFYGSEVKVFLRAESDDTVPAKPPVAIATTAHPAQ